ncbi:hypothetical protein PMAYCL1PPCAC_24844, partial [Pristionchus mayeri]
FRMSPPRKIRKTEGDQVSSTDGVIRFEVDNVSDIDIFDGGRYSPSINVGGINWSAKVLKELDNIGTEVFSFYLYNMDFKSVMGSIDVRAQFVIINRDTSKCFSAKTLVTFKHSSDAWGYRHLMQWDELVD